MINVENSLNEELVIFHDSLHEVQGMERKVRKGRTRYRNRESLMKRQPWRGEFDFRYVAS